MDEVIDYVRARRPQAACACTSKACVATDAEGLKGTVAKDSAVMTKVTCKKSTAKQVVT
jgi:hypothetical protein